VVTFRPGQKLKARVEAYEGEEIQRDRARQQGGDDSGSKPAAAAGQASPEIGFGMRAFDGGTD
jgi:hypothetical protein